MTLRFIDPYPRSVSRAALATGLILALASSLFGGGPRDPLPGGRVLKWNADKPVLYLLDQEFSETRYAHLGRRVHQAFQVWEDVETSTLQVQNPEPRFLEENVDGSNFAEYTGSRRPENLIIFDQDGEISDLVFGEGAGENVLGFAAFRFVDEDALEYSFGYTVIGQSPASQPDDFYRVTMHEVGHLLGLDHTQAGMEWFESDDLGDVRFVPVMYPIGTLFGTNEPLLDDAIWISWLYPEESFAAGTGTIRGRVRRRTGAPVLGANVVAAAVELDAAGNLTEVQGEQVGVVSDFLVTDDGSYQLPGLPPGTYVVFIEPLNPRFTKESSVGPYDVLPGRYAARFTSFPKDYYNGDGESGTPEDDTAEKVVLEVAAGQVVSGIDLQTNEEVNQLSLLEDDGEMIFEFPEGFSFPFFGTTYTDVVVNSDGNLTFGIGDGQPGRSRSERRFLSGPPRIALFFSDLNPEAGGEVRAETGEGSLTFIWDGVPEFALAGTRPGNDFSVTLFANGDILLDYGQVNVTPDPEDIQAIVGITPGSGATARIVDFSEEPVSYEFGTSGLYQVFPETDFDLSGRQLLFTAPGRELLFPFYRGDLDDFSGFAITNDSRTDAVMAVEAFSNQGDPLFPLSSGVRRVGAGQQLAQLGREFFDTRLSTRREGWMRIRSSTPELAGFFLYFKDLAGPSARMDGAVAFTSGSRLLYFTRIFEGRGTFPSENSDQAARTTLALANSSDQPTTVRLTLFGSDGAPLGGPESFMIADHGRLAGSITDLFGPLGGVSHGHVQVEVTQGSGVVGFQLIELGDTVLGLNATESGTEPSLYSAQLASGAGTGDAGGYFTSIKLINSGEEETDVRLVAFQSDGNRLGRPYRLRLAPRESFQGNASEVFGLEAPPQSILVGSVAVDGTHPGLIGDVIFGDPVGGEYAAALTLQTEPLRRAVFSQVANGERRPGDTLPPIFTGIAVFNPGDVSTEVSLQVYDSQGVLQGEAGGIAMQPKARFSDLIQNLVPPTRGLLGGFVVLESNPGRVVAQELFGNGRTFLSSVPPSSGD
ncbi:MAG: matrixin family metalloprotease [Candidatus Aminicenantes bacterium]|nr:matrixin family metalloprotease [Candidatus Aminicenantes bacterium]